MTWKPTTRGNGEKATLSEAVGQALGSASMCWENVIAAGMFNSSYALEVHEGLMAFLSDHLDEVRAQAVVAPRVDAVSRSGLDHTGHGHEATDRAIAVCEGATAFLGGWADHQAKVASEAVRLVALALHIRQYGERAPGGDETWAQFDRDADALLRHRSGRITG